MGSATASVTVPTASATMTMTTWESNAESHGEEVLRLTLRSRPNVTWDENVVDNEGLGRKSSKRCCIFHKQKAFGESSTESSEEDRDDDSTSSSSSGGGMGAQRPMARKKDGKKKG